MNRVREKLTYSNVISTLCLFLLLGGGTAFAASQLEKESVGTNQLKKGAVTPSKLSKASKETLTGRRGATGAQGPQGPQGAPAVPGQDLTAGTPLSSGKTETGVFGTAGGSSESGYLGATVSFVQPLPAPLDKAHAITVTPHEAYSDHCLGPGRADPGYLCVYAYQWENLAFFNSPEDPGDDTYGASRDGAFLMFKISAGYGARYVYGTWAVTAP
jgi:hypothetical protein